ncbi:MAG: cold shock domain-containing protein [Candidatus Marinimicrobia bacterium]|nr:cold shock domain-containing protein [Candidatus Neomarinimicrobiota bacterium]
MSGVRISHRPRYLAENQQVEFEVGEGEKGSVAE